MAVKTYRDLIAWQLAMDLVVDVYKATQFFPREELYGLTSQIRRAAVSIPSNIAEGQGRGIGAEFTRHLRISQGSVQEVETQLLIAERLTYLDVPYVEQLINRTAEVGRVVRGLHDTLASDRQPKTRN